MKRAMPASLSERSNSMSSELRVFVPLAIRALIDGLMPRMEAAAGASLSMAVDLNPAIAERIAAGEAFDMGLTNPPYVAALVASGYADGAHHRAFGRVPLAIGRRAGTEEPVRTSAGEIAALIRRAESIGYTGAGTSGRTYLDAVSRLGVADEIAPRSHAMGGGEPVAAVAAGRTELAVAPLTTILAAPGIVPAAIFAEDVRSHIDISVFLRPMPRAGARTLFDFLTASDLDADLAAAGVMRFELA